MDRGGWMNKLGPKW